MEETWWEHHVVPVEPKLNTILCVELHLVSSPCESASCEYHGSAPAVDPEASIVDGTIALTQEARTDWPHQPVNSPRAHPHLVHNSESSMKRVSTVLSLAHLDSFEESTDST